MIICSVDGHHLAFFIGQNIIIVSFAIRNKAALRTLMQVYLVIYMALHIFFLARFARSVFKTLINNKMYCTIRHKHKSIHHIRGSFNK